MNDSYSYKSKKEMEISIKHALKIMAQRESVLDSITDDLFNSEKLMITFFNLLASKDKKKVQFDNSIEAKKTARRRVNFYQSCYL